MARETQRIGAILLAGGASRRFGPGDKLLADFGGEPLVRRVARTFVDAGVADIVAVTGPDPQILERTLAGLRVLFAHNAAWADGMGGSIAAGARALDHSLDGAFIVPGDMPFLTADVARRLAAAFEGAGRARAIFPETAEGEQRNPVLWPRRLFPALAALGGEAGAKSLLHAENARAVAVRFEEAALFWDIDTAGDLAAARDRMVSAAEGAIPFRPHGRA